VSWCDKLASVPGAGFGIDAHFASSDSILSGITSLTDALFSDSKPHFSLTHQASFEVRFSTETGLNYTIEPTRVAVEFKHQMRPRAISGGLPVMEMLSRPLPFTELLPQVTKRLVEVALLVPGAKTRKVNRIGVLSTTAVSEKEVPPGVSRFIEYIGRPWHGAVEAYSFQITSDIGKGAGYRDRCLHTIVLPEDKESLMTMTFDFQRLFTSGMPIQQQAPLKEAVDRVEKAALRYFEDIGEGKRFDEAIISQTAGV
jgi:hypothetical protein